MLDELNRTSDPEPSEWAWRRHARCRHVDDDLFFDAQNPAAEQAAKAICNECPVLFRCRDYAVAAAEPHGIWGGLSPTERKRQRWLDKFRNRPSEMALAQ
ncbi:WhiB family transcriptional regulator [Rhodococcus opacus]|uniref:WhiB family transcriptional regulator n=1 Tax=Rhodococcus opacus TaxID=37919 RepID=UPI001C47BB7E|nr:WhiB family transcriptional regulator [Rhodococcus opacus]MBV6754845.1 WhiB family transcriptional regulator [Rhodococcus opacus]